MDEEQLRGAIREIIARRLGASAPAACAAERPEPAWTFHVSHGRLRMLPASGSSPCLIEPAVPCNHCGYCQSLGH
ncbi:MAG: hypothetical protein AB7I50_09740 [Vicinamibacterales bacterium]